MFRAMPPCFFCVPWLRKKMLKKQANKKTHIISATTKIAVTSKKSRTFFSKRKKEAVCDPSIVISGVFFVSPGTRAFVLVFCRPCVHKTTCSALLLVVCEDKKTIKLIITHRRGFNQHHCFLPTRRRYVRTLNGSSTSSQHTCSDFRDDLSCTDFSPGCFTGPLKVHCTCDRSRFCFANFLLQKKKIYL